jgi:uroporphyrinogen III methyltransferase/synthase
VRATLATISAKALAPPATIVIGDVAALDLAWFERRPLFGHRIVVTRAREQASELTGRLEAVGAEVIELPAIKIEDPDDGGAALRRAAANVREYDWLVLTSANGAQRLLAELRDGRELGGVEVAAIGPGTAEALLRANVRADLVPTRFVAEALLDEFPPAPSDRAGRVLLARAEVARDVLPDGLRDRGWDVDVVVAYKTVAAPVSDLQLATAAGADVITFTSSSTVDRYLEVAGTESVPAVVACIGPITAATARAHGLHVDVEAPVHSLSGLVDAIVNHFGDG